jgi:hypothetical protein
MARNHRTINKIYPFRQIDDKGIVKKYPEALNE